MKLDLSTLLTQKRFRPPEGWDWSFQNCAPPYEKMKIRYGQVRSRKSYKAVAVIIGGLGDFGEQYFELANQLEENHFKTIIIDTLGQGGSTRLLPSEPMKRHTQGFDIALVQIHKIIDEIVLSSAIDAEDNHKRLPIIMIAHSMGGHLGLRYLSEYNQTSRGKNIFSCAIFSAPMLGIKAVNNFPKIIRNPLLRLLALRPTAYVPGGCDWFDGYREREGFKGIFSSDPVRYELQRAYFNDPGHQFLVTGSPTNKWLLEAYLSCQKMEETGYLEKIKIPILIGLAKDDQLVDNQSIKNAAMRLTQGELLPIPECQHEILMESDRFRQPFIDRIFTFIDDNVLSKADNGKTYIQ